MDAVRLGEARKLFGSRPDPSLWSPCDRSPLWLGVLETTAQILVVPPFYGSLGKRLIKSPKVYVADAGLACHLLGIETGAELGRSPFLGSLYEGFIAAEIVKALEVDFLVPGPRGTISVVECRASRTPTPAMAAPMRKLAEALARRRGGRAAVAAFLVHEASAARTDTRAFAPGVSAVPWREFVAAL